MSEYPAPSSCGAHHVKSDGLPAYTTRYNWVLPFHEPGLAPVEDSSGSHHITVGGFPAYESRFDRTFGFYEGLATVKDGDHWYHINPIGKRVYDSNWEWCGNFQGGYCVVRKKNRMFHIDPSGAVMNQDGWTYAGDFREGTAVVRTDSGMCKHIDMNCRFLCDREFEQLGVFHKGFATARDEGGWHHINRDGEPVYPFRFESAEPFYNGVARAVTRAGLDVLVDEDGCIIPLQGQRHQKSSEQISFPLTQLSGDPIEDERLVREQMAFITQHMYQKGYNFSIDGNISHKLPDGNLIVSPSGQHLGFIRPEDFIVVDQDGNLVRGDRSRTSEWRLHVRIHAWRPDIQCVIHAHPPSALAASIAGIDLTKVYTTISPIPMTEYALNCTEESPQAVKPFIHSHNWAILPRHGVVTWGDSLSNAFLRLEGLEHSARVLAKANAIGTIEPMPEKDVRNLFEMWGLDFDSYQSGSGTE